jgi:hypothetical protein
VSLAAPRALAGRAWSLGAVAIPSGTTGWTAASTGLACGTPGATISLAVPEHLHDGATLATVDILCMPWTGSHGPSHAGTATLYRRTLTAGATPPVWTSIGTVSLSGTGWGGGNVIKATMTVGVTISPTDVVKLEIADEDNAGLYTGGNVYAAAVFNYTISDCRPW